VGTGAEKGKKTQKDNFLVRKKQKKGGGKMTPNGRAVQKIHKNGQSAVRRTPEEHGETRKHTPIKERRTRERNEKRH